MLRQGMSSPVFALAAIIAWALTPPVCLAQFTDVTSGALGDPGSGFGVAWGDYDRDGDLDLYVTNDGANVLLRNDGGGSFADVTSGPLGDTGNGSAAPWGDYDNDGDLDLYLVNYGSGNKLLRNDGAAGFADATGGPLGNTGNGLGGSWADYDNDGDVDLYVVRYGQSNLLLRNQGGGAFVDATSGPLGDTGYGLGVAWADYDNDGDLDLYVTNDGANKLLRNQGAGVFVDASAGPLADSGPGQGVAWGDYDNDGDLDLYIANYGMANKLLRNDGGGIFTNVTSGPLGDTGHGTGVAWGDYDDDGDLDLYLVNDGEPNKLLRNDLANGNRWLHVNLVGVLSNRSGIGARVKVVAGGVTRIDEVSGGSGYLSQNSLTAEFGLGAATVVDSLVIRWPSGVVQKDVGVAGNQRLTLVEHSGTSVGVGPPAAALTVELSAATPNPFGEATRIRYALPATGSVRLSVHDVQGRLVALLAEGMQVSGWHSVAWTGRGARGESMCSGVYLVRLEVAGETRVGKVVLTR